MSSTLQLPAAAQAPLSLERRASLPAAATSAAPDPGERPSMRRYLPLAVLATGAVIVLPAALVASLVPRSGLLWMLVSCLAAVVLSLAFAAAGAALWKRQPRSRDVVFSELMLWCWLRRCWTERRLSQARELFDSARKAGPNVNIELLVGLSRLLEARDAYVHGHGQRVSRHARRIARTIGLPAVEIAKISTAALVHDVGKLYTPREILNNPQRLSDAEFEVVKRHAADGAEMLGVVGDPEITAIVRHHHERIDGRGYPDHLLGPEIPLGARIIAVADTFDAITSNRAYRPAGAQKKALDVLSAVAGTQLDVAAVEAFMHGYSARRSVAWFAFAASASQRALAWLSGIASNLGVSAGSLSPLLPAIGAAGVLAVSPGAFREAGFDQSPSSAALARARVTRSASTSASAAAPSRDERGSRGPREAGARAAPKARPGGATTTGATGGRGAGAGVNAPVTRPASPTPSAIPTVPATPIAVAPSAPPVGVPIISTPSRPPTLSQPTLSPPSTGVPAPTTPSAGLGGITVPSVTTPSVTIAPATGPSVTVPPVTVPGATLPSVK